MVKETLFETSEDRLFLGLLVLVCVGVTLLVYALYEPPTRECVLLTCHDTGVCEFQCFDEVHPSHKSIQEENARDVECVRTIENDLWVVNCTSQPPETTSWTKWSAWTKNGTLVKCPGNGKLLLENDNDTPNYLCVYGSEVCNIYGSVCEHWISGTTRWWNETYDEHQWNTRYARATEEP